MIDPHPLRVVGAVGRPGGQNGDLAQDCGIPRKERFPNPSGLPEKLPAKKSRTEKAKARRNADNWRRGLCRPLHELRAHEANVRLAKRLIAEQRKAVAAAERTQRSAARRDRQRENSRAWRLANPERQRELVRAWKRTNRDKVRAAKRGRDRKSTVRRRAWLMEAQHGRCAICRERLGADTHIDHVMPRALGGSNRRSNLQLTCAPCNLSKGARHPIDHARSLGRLL